MVEAVAEKQICEKCGADVREKTAFCYNCGESVLTAFVEDESTGPNGSSEPKDETKAALDDLADKFKIDEEEDDRLAKAAAERRKARVSNRKSARYEWQPTEDSPNLLFLLLTAAIFVLAVVAVVLTAIWK